MLKKITINSHTISYRDNEVNKPVIFFLHGNSQSSKIFEKQFSDKNLNENFRLIAIDLPGCGKSEFSKTPDTTYTFNGLIKIIIEFINKLSLKDITFVGSSLGGYILIDALPQLKEAKGLMFFGTAPISHMADFENALKISTEDFSSMFNEHFSDEVIEFLVQALFATEYKSCPDFLIDDLKNSDGKLRVSLGVSLANGEHLDEVNILKNTTLPIAILQGAEESAVKASYLESLNIPSLWKNKIHIVEKAGHTLQYEQPEIFNKVLSEFAKFCL